ncbi:MAG TPA: hypothetical protein VGK99_17215 [Acidobacteriota bacterium]|jgi:hypothetical protein
MAKRVIPALLLIAGFTYFMLRDAQRPGAVQTGSPDDALLDMVQAMGEGSVSQWVDLFGGDLRRRLEDISQRQGEGELSRLLKDRSGAVKGFAIIGRQTQGPDTIVLSTETIYAERNTRQSFLLRKEAGIWKIVDSDSEMVSAWGTNYGRPVRE